MSGYTRRDWVVLGVVSYRISYIGSCSKVTIGGFRAIGAGGGYKASYNGPEAFLFR
jgi:hypothetical protein